MEKLRNKTFAKNFTFAIEKWCRKTGRSQKAFADECGVHQNIIVRYKRGEAHPSPVVLESMLKVLGYEDAAWFYQENLTPYEHIKAAFELLIKRHGIYNAKNLLLSFCADAFKEKEGDKTND